MRKKSNILKECEREFAFIHSYVKGVVLIRNTYHSLESIREDELSPELIILKKIGGFYLNLNDGIFQDEVQKFLEEFPSKFNHYMSGDLMDNKTKRLMDRCYKEAMSNTEHYRNKDLIGMYNANMKFIEIILKILN